VVNRVRRAFDAQKAGHGGTLDPLATGVLPIAFGAATKTVPYVMDGTKLLEPPDESQMRLGSGLEQRRRPLPDGGLSQSPIT
jgi:tRNA U55 pseudouridine synthase TruB